MRRWRRISARGRGGLVVYTVIPTIAFTTVLPLLLKALVDDDILPRNTRTAVMLVAALAVLLIIVAAGALADRVLGSRLTISVTNEIRLRLFEHAQQLSISHVCSDVDAVERELGIELRSALMYSMTIVVGAFVLLSVQWRLALVALTLIPLVYLSQKIFGFRDDRATRVR